MIEGLKLVLGALYTFIGCWIILGTLTFDVAPNWYIVVHILGALLFLGFSPWICKKLGV